MEIRSKRIGHIVGGYLAIAVVCGLVAFLIIVVIMVIGGKR